MRTLSDGRQRRSRREWKKIVDRFEQSGLSENRFCIEQKLTRKTFRAWRQRFADEADPAPDFVELVTPGPADDLGQTKERHFELSLPGGVTLRWRA